MAEVTDHRAVSISIRAEEKDFHTSGVNWCPLSKTMVVGLLCRQNTW